MKDVPTYRLLSGQKREIVLIEDRPDDWGDEIERQEREDREREKGE